jgi:pimeloyl-ACP methyl ester carboxylesterase
MVMPVLMQFETSRPEKGVPIVLVPGGLSGWISWKPHAEILSKDYRVIRVQLLNMTAAEKNQIPEEGYSLRSESEALKRTLDKLEVEKVNLVGWSHGGEVSLDFALNYPSRINTLTLIEPATYWVARAYGQFEDEQREFTEFIRGIHAPVTEDDLIRFLKWNGLVPEGMDPKSMPQWPVWNRLKPAFLSLHTVIEHADDLGRLRVLHDVPVMLVRGRDSVGFNFGIADMLSKSLGSNAKIVTLPDAHASHIIAKDKFIEELQHFIRGSK